MRKAPLDGGAFLCPGQWNCRLFALVDELNRAEAQMKTPKVSAARNSGLQDDHDPADIGQRNVSKAKAQKSQKEGPAAYAPHEEGEAAYPNRDPAKKKTGEF